MGDKLQKINIVALLFIMMMLLTACASKSADTTWQEQYDLGMQYLTDGDYEAAIVAFTAAIEIDAKDVQAYTGLVQAYIGTADYEAAVSAAGQGGDVLGDSGQEQADGAVDEFTSALLILGELCLEEGDYESAEMTYYLIISIDENIVEAYIGLAQVYIQWGDYTSALEILQNGKEKTGSDSEIDDMIDEVTSLYIDDMIAHEDYSFFFEGEMLALEEWTVNGTPITEATFDDFWAAYPCELWSYDRWYDYYYNGDSWGSHTYMPWSYSVPVTDPEDGRAYDNRIGNLRVYPDLSVVFGYNDYTNYQPELRGIQMGENTYSVLKKLGFSDVGIDYLIENKQLWEEKLEDGITGTSSYLVKNAGTTIMAILVYTTDDGVGITVSYFYNLDYQIHFFFSSEEILTSLTLQSY